MSDKQYAIRNKQHILLFAMWKTKYQSFSTIIFSFFVGIFLYFANAVELTDENFEASHFL